MNVRKLLIAVLLFVIALSACTSAGAPASAPTSPPTNAPATAAPAASDPSKVAATSPTTATNSTVTNDATQARLRVSQCVDGAPDMDVLVNGKVLVLAGVPQFPLHAGAVSRYEYLAPGTVRVAVVPTGMSIDKAFLAPLDVTLEAGHRYTLVVLGEADETSHKALVIDETKAYQEAGITPSSSSHITVNNIKGSPSISFLQDGVGEKDVPYGGFAATAPPARNFKTFTVSVGGQVVENNGAGFTGPGDDLLDCYYGSYSSTGKTVESSNSSATTTGLNTIDYLQGYSAEHARDGGHVPSFNTFLAAVKTAGLTDLLTTGGPYLLFAPTDEAFAALPKEQLDTLRANPKALGALLRAHIVMGYNPTGTLGNKVFDRTLTNLLGEQLVLSGNTENWDSFAINGVTMGLFQAAMAANGNRVLFITKLIQPAAK